MRSTSVSGSVSGVIAGIFTAIWKRFGTVFGSSRKIIFVDEERENVIINEYGEINMDAVNDIKDRDIKIKIKEMEKN
jgi:hypothetical protein